MLRCVILGLLRDGKPRHGYALMKAYRELSGIEIGPGSFYRDLPRLVAERLIRPTENPPDADERRVPYAITDAGAAAFDTWFTEHPPANSTECREDDLGARMAFFAEAKPEATRKVIGQWQDELWIQAKRLERAHELAVTRTRSASDPPKFPILALQLQRRLRHLDTDVTFLKEIHSLYDNWTSSPASVRQLAQRRSTLADRPLEKESSTRRRRSVGSSKPRAVSDGRR
jgi:DNA-binding PadR family transcriptional regulator